MASASVAAAGFSRQAQRPGRAVRAAAVSVRFQRRFSPGCDIRNVTGTHGEVVIVVFDDGSKEMEITLINCQAEEPDQEVCHHVP
jgi:hypothetical protein